MVTKVLSPSDYVIQKTKKSAPQVVHGDKLKICHCDTPTSWLRESQKDEETTTDAIDDVIVDTADKTTQSTSPNDSYDIIDDVTGDDSMHDVTDAETDESDVETTDRSTDVQLKSILSPPKSKRQSPRSDQHVHFDEETMNRPTPIIRSPQFRRLQRPVRRRVHFDDESVVDIQPTQRHNRYDEPETDRQSTNSRLWPTEDGGLMVYARRRSDRDTRWPSRYQHYSM